MDIDAFLRSVPDLPGLSGTLTRAVEMLGKDDIELNHLTSFLSHDQAIVGRLLRVANSPFYGVAGRVATIPQAVNVIGFANTKRIIVALSIMGRFPGGRLGGIDMAAFWRHSVVIAIMSQMVAEKAGLPAEQVFIGGILHDIGRIVLAMQAPADYETLVAEAGGRMPSPEAERARLGFDHAQVGSGLAARWNFPAEIAAILLQHHGQGHRDDAAGIIALAEELIGWVAAGDAPPEAGEPSVQAPWTRLAWTEDEWRATVEQVTLRADALASMI